MARTDLEQLVFQMSADIAKMNKQLKDGERRVDSSASWIEKRLAEVDRKTARSWRELERSIGAGMQRTSQVAQAALAGVIAYSIRAASNAAEIENAFDVAFESNAASARMFSEELADIAGRDPVVLREGMSRLQLVIRGLGVDAAQSQAAVQALTSRAVDVGSLFNVADAEALQAMISGISGEAEPLKRFGVVLNETAVKAELLSMGFKGNASEASEAAKAIARTRIILERTAVAQGDAAKTADGAANSAKRMTAEFNKAARELGEQLLPAATAAAGGVTKLLESFNSLSSGTQMAGLAMLALVAAGGPIATLIGGLGKVIKIAVAARAAILSVGAGTAVAGAAGFALLEGVAINDDMKGVLADKLTRNPGSMQTQMEQLAAKDSELIAARSWYDQGFRAAKNPEDVKLLDKLIADRLEAPAKRAAFQAQKQIEDAIAALTLSEEQMSPVQVPGAGGGAAKAGKRWTGTLPENIRALVAEGRMTEETARETWPEGNFPLDMTALADLLEPQTINPATTWDSMTPLEIDTSAPDFGAGAPEVVGSGRWMMSPEDARRVEEQWASTIGGGLRAAIYGGTDEMAMYFAQTLTDALIDNLAADLASFLRQGLGGGGGGAGGGSGSWLASAASALFSGGGGGGGFSLASIFGGGRPGIGVSGSPAISTPPINGHLFAGMFAAGGTIPRGQWGIVGEAGAEAVRAGPNGIEVKPNSALRALTMPAMPAAVSSGGGARARLAPTTVNVNIKLDGANGDQAIRAIAREETAAGVRQGLRAASRAQPDQQLRLATLGYAG